MALNSSGPISLGGSTAGQSVNLELGQSATATISLGDSNVRSLAGVPSGAISLDNLHGKSAVSVHISNWSVTDTQFSTASYAAYSLNSNGAAYEATMFTGPTFIENWITPQSNMGDYECLATVISSIGTPGGTFGSWLNLGTTWVWSTTQPAVIGYKYVEFSLAIRRVGTTTNLTSAVITLEAQTEV